MPPKANTPAPPTQLAEPGVSGKFVIMGILGLALVAAGASWLFRYNATHRAAEFWGSGVAQRIREAPIVDLARLGRSEMVLDGTAPFLLDSGEYVYVVSHFDASDAHGLAHLRNALLEDRSFVWPASRDITGTDWKWLLGFRDESNGRRTFIVFTADCAQLTIIDSPRSGQISCEPIAAGLKTVFEEWSQSEGSAVPPDKAAPAR